MPSPWQVTALDDNVTYNLVVPDGTVQMLGRTDSQIGCTNTATNIDGGGLCVFPGFDVAVGSTILTAKLSFKSIVTHAGTTVNAHIIGAKELNPASPWSGTNAQFRARRGTDAGGATNDFITSKVEWNNIEAWTDGNWYDSPDFAPVIQEIIDQVGWTSGNNIMLYVDDCAHRSTQANGVYRDYFCYQDDAASAPILTVTWTSPETGSVMYIQQFMTLSNMTFRGVGV